MAENPITRIPQHSKTRASIGMTTAADGLSEIIDLGGGQVSSYCLTTSWTSTNMTFRGSHNSTDNMYNIYASSGGEIVHEVQGGTMMTFGVRSEFGAIRYLQFRSGTSAAPVALASTQSICLGILSQGSN